MRVDATATAEWGASDQPDEAVAGAQVGPPAQPGAPGEDGTVVANRYAVDLGEPLGTGGMAVVYRGRDLRTRRQVALRTLRAEYRGNPATRARFRHETRLQAFASHPNIARVFDLHEDQEAPWAVHEYVPGPSLQELLRERGPFPPAEVADLLDQVAAALAHLHAKGLVHLDVTPKNLLVTPEGVVKLIDFGLAQHAGLVQEPIGGATFGTAAYLAPEQARGEPVEPTTDIYALGCVVYELLTGEPPFTLESVGGTKHDVVRAHLERTPLPPSKARPDLDLPPAVDDVLLWALAKPPNERYHDVTSFARLFRSAVERQPIGDLASGTTPLPPLQTSAADRASTRRVGGPVPRPPTTAPPVVRNRAHMPPPLATLGGPPTAAEASTARRPVAEVGS
ncbi:MAG: hypothetical protein AVDCRST_MAG49-559, partial [uncultured Thermomicrobiales bacterium]